MNRETGQPFSYHDACIERGARVGYDAHAAAEARKAVEQFLPLSGTSVRLKKVLILDNFLDLPDES
jgi:hypothetical protein